MSRLEIIAHMFIGIVCGIVIWVLILPSVAKIATTIKKRFRQYRCYRLMKSKYAVYKNGCDGVFPSHKCDDCKYYYKNIEENKEEL